MHLPSAAKLWHMPQPKVLPVPVPLLLLSEPLDVHAASYLAESARILSLSLISISSLINIITSPEHLFDIIIAHMFDNVNRNILVFYI